MHKLVEISSEGAKHPGDILISFSEIAMKALDILQSKSPQK